MRRAVLIALLIGGAGASGEEVKRMQPMLGTYVEITAAGQDKAQLQAAIDEAFEAIKKVDRLISSFRSDSEVEEINRCSGRREVAVSPWTFECLRKAVHVGEQSRGAFDVSCRPLLDLWGFLKREYRLPSATEQRIARELVDYRQLELKEWPGVRMQAPRRTAYLKRSGMRIDLGGVGKGFAVDKAALALRQAGVEAGLVRAWGDVYGFGDRDWAVKITGARSVKIRNQAVSSSGNYENFFEIDGKKYSHIIDPRTGNPVEGVRGVTVRAARCTDADAWATAIFVDPGLRPAGIEVVFFDRE
jgi:thiamine biosynthesis lipoprotein